MTRLLFRPTYVGMLHRRGALLAAALVAMVVAGSILLSILQTVVAHHRQTFTHRQQVQAQWLAQGGIDRAVAQLRSSSEYRGETWNVPEDELSGSAPGKVVIRVEPLADEPNALQISAQADYPSDTDHRARQTREVVVHLNKSTE